jgi:hypothetical protein
MFTGALVVARQAKGRRGCSQTSSSMTRSRSDYRVTEVACEFINGG